MKQEQIAKLDELRSCLYDIKRHLEYMKNWEDNLNAVKDERFNLIIQSRYDGKVVLEKPITREDAEREFNATMSFLTNERQRLEKEIEDL